MVVDMQRSDMKKGKTTSPRFPSKGAEPIRLHFRDVDTQIVVTPEDQDRFVTTSSEAAQACKMAQDALRWKQEFDGFLKYIHDWCAKHTERVAYAYLSFSSDGLKLFLLTHGADYRFDFDDVVSDFDIELDKKFPNCPGEVMQLPETPVESLTSFFDPAKAFQLHGE